MSETVGQRHALKFAAAILFGKSLGGFQDCCWPHHINTPKKFIPPEHRRPVKPDCIARKPRCQFAIGRNVDKTPRTCEVTTGSDCNPFRHILSNRKEARGIILDKTVSQTITHAAVSVPAGAAAIHCGRYP